MFSWSHPWPWTSLSWKPFSLPSLFSITWKPQPLLFPVVLEVCKPHGHSLKRIVDVHPAILGQTDEESMQGNPQVLEMLWQEWTKESDPKHSKHLPERSKTMPDFNQRSRRQGMQISCKWVLPGNHRNCSLKIYSPCAPVNQGPFSSIGSIGYGAGHWPAWRRGWELWYWPCLAPTAGWRGWSGPGASQPCK